MSDKVCKATMTREQWRAMYLQCDTAPLTHKASLKWLSAATAEIHDTAEVIHNVAGGLITAKDFADGHTAKDPVTLELSHDAIKAIKMVSINELVGSKERPAASLLRRKQMFDALKEVGPNGSILRMVQKEATLPDDPEADKDLDFDEKPKES